MKIKPDNPVRSPLWWFFLLIEGVALVALVIWISAPWWSVPAIALWAYLHDFTESAERRFKEKKQEQQV